MFRQLAGLDNDKNNPEFLLLLQSVANELKLEKEKKEEIKEAPPLIPLDNDIPVERPVYMEEHKPLAVIPRFNENAISTRNGSFAGIDNNKSFIKINKTHRDKLTNKSKEFIEETSIFLPKRTLDLSLLAGNKPIDTTTYILNNTANNKIFGRQMQKSFNDKVILQGESAKEKTLIEIKEVPKIIPVTTVNHPITDMNLKKSSLEIFDFCDELSEKTLLQPIDSKKLDCMQKFFIKMGGTEKGKYYPTKDNLSLYNLLATWGEYKHLVRKLSENLTNRSLRVQMESMEALHGFVTDKQWLNLPKKLTCIQISIDNSMVAIDSNNHIWRYIPGSQWTKLDGQASQVSMGVDGAIWCVDNKGFPYEWTEESKSWKQMPGDSILKLAVFNAINIWAYTIYGQVWYWNGLGWQLVDGSITKDIGSGIDGSVVCIGERNKIYLRSGTVWNEMGNKTGDVVTIGDIGNIWCIENNKVYKWSGMGKWEEKPGIMRTIACGPNGKLVLAIDMDGIVHMWDKNGWLEVSNV
jgi:hypothetical protein